MYNFILQILITVSLGVIIYLIARKVPEISDAMGDGTSRPKFLKHAANIINSFPIEKVDFWISQALEKILRKARVYLLGLDNFLIKHLENFKRTKKFQSENRTKKYSLFKNNGNSKGEDGDLESEVENDTIESKE